MMTTCCLGAGVPCRHVVPKLDALYVGDAAIITVYDRLVALELFVFFVSVFILAPAWRSRDRRRCT